MQRRGSCTLKCFRPFATRQFHLIAAGAKVVLPLPPLHTHPCIHTKAFVVIVAYTEWCIPHLLLGSVNLLF